MNLLADESVDFGIIEALRTQGYKVEAIIEINPSIDDDEILEIAIEKDSLLLTEDKDFGELTYRLKKPNRGILLIRLSGLTIEKKIEMVLETLDKYENELKDHFSVLSANKLRIRNP